MNRTKPTKWHMRPVGSGQPLSLCASGVAKALSYLHAGSEDYSRLAAIQVDLDLCWPHMTLCWFCRVMA